MTRPTNKARLEKLGFKVRELDAGRAVLEWQGEEVRMTALAGDDLIAIAAHWAAHKVSTSD